MTTKKSISLFNVGCNHLLFYYTQLWTTTVHDNKLIKSLTTSGSGITHYCFLSLMWMKVGRNDIIVQVSGESYIIIFTSQSQ
jgi:hypothetical protein